MKRCIAERLLRLPEVKHLTGLSKSSIYARIAEDSFPRQISLGARTVVWSESDIQKWSAETISAEREDFPLPIRRCSKILFKNRDKSRCFQEYLGIRIIKIELRIRHFHSAKSDFIYV